MLAYLLARGGVAVTLLESRPDFDRQFRGDTLAPPVLELLDTLGLADPLLASVPHGTADAFMWSTPTRSYRLADYRRTSAKYPYYALVPQGRFLPFMVEEAARFHPHPRFDRPGADRVDEHAAFRVAVGEEPRERELGGLGDRILGHRR